MATSDIKIQSVDIAAEIVLKCPGFALDIGGSAVKFVYRTKTEYEKAKKGASKAGLCFLTCSRNSLDEALSKVKEDVYITREEGTKPKVYSCGLGGYLWNDKLKETFQVEIENVVEGDCMFEGLRYLLHNIPQTDFMHPLPIEEMNNTTEIMDKLMNQWRAMIKKSKIKYSEQHSGPLPYEPMLLSDEKSMYDCLGDDLYPACLITLGSVYSFLKISKDAPPSVLQSSILGGRYFLGMGSLLTGAKSYDELIDLAEKGNHLNVNQSLSSQGKGTEEAKKDNDPYALLSESESDMVVFSFGHAVYQDLAKFRKEDIAQAWLIAHITQIVQITHVECKLNGIKTFLIGGGFANREFVRKHFIREMIRLDCSKMLTYHQQFKPLVCFMKQGSHMGAFGAMLNSIEKFTKERDNVSVK